MIKLFPRLSLRTARGWVRLFRLAFLLLLLLLVGVVLYLHEAGLPQFIKTPVIAKLREQGWDVQFKNMRLGVGTSLIIDSPSFRRLDPSFAADISARRTDVHLNATALLHRKIVLSAARIVNGQFHLPLANTNAGTLSVTNIGISLHLLTNGTAELRQGKATFHGVHIQIEGAITNYAALPSWPIFHTGAKTNRNLQASLAQFANVMNQISFTESPKILLRVYADGKKPETLRSSLIVGAKAVQSPWANVNGLRLSFNTDLAAKPMFSLHADAEHVSSAQGQATNLDFVASLSTIAADTNLFTGVVEISASGAHAQFSTNWIATGNLLSRAELNGYYEAGKFFFHSFDTTVSAKTAGTRWGTADTVRFTARGDVSTNITLSTNGWGAWSKLRPFTADWGAEITGVKSPKIQVQSLACSGHWKPPQLTISQLHAKLYDRDLQADVSLDVASRRVHADATSDFDPMKITGILTTNVQRWLKQFTWQEAPKVQASCSFVLPQWANRHPDWRAEVRPTLQIAGKFSGKSGTFREVPVDNASGSFTYTNQTWDVPDLVAHQNGGTFAMHYTGNDETHEYHFVVNSDADPTLARPIVPEDQQHWIDELKFTTPPNVRCDVRGRWHSRELTGFTATIHSTNFTFHDERIDSLNAQLRYTNLFLKISNVDARQNRQAFTTPNIEANFASKTVVLTNVYSSIDPRKLKRYLGAKTPTWMREMEFFHPPDIRCSGFFNYTNPIATDLQFTIGGEGFRWTNLAADTIVGNIYWKGRTVLITNVDASVYGAGKANGWGVLNYAPKKQTDFHFFVSAVDVELPLITQGLTGKTNRLEGKIDTEIHITSGNSRDLHSINGYGFVNVHDALIWDIPMFGVFSPILNSISPGSGNSRAREAKATFAIVNGNIYTDDLEIYATGYRLLYRGYVGLDKKLDAKVEAELLRNTAVIGPILRYALAPLSKLFEYHITGTINHPVKQPVFIPKFLMMILRPFHTLKESMNAEPGEPASAPPAQATPKNK